MDFIVTFLDFYYFLLQYICTLTRARRIIICCWIFALFYSSPWLLLTHIKFSCIKGFGMVPKCDFRLNRDSTMYIAMFFTDITLFYLIPLVLSVVLYTLIAIMLLFTAPRTFNDGTVRNQARLQVNLLGHPSILFYVLIYNKVFTENLNSSVDNIKIIFSCNYLISFMRRIAQILLLPAQMI